MNKVLCEDVRLLLSLYIDDMLPDEEMTMVREHIESCDSCRDEYALLKGIMEQTKGLPELEVSAEFSASLSKKIAVEAERKRAREEEKEAPQVHPMFVPKRRIYPAFLATAAAIAISVFALSNLPEIGMPAKDNNAKMETSAPDAVEATIDPAKEENALSKAREIEFNDNAENNEAANAPVAASLAADVAETEETQTAERAKDASAAEKPKAQAVYTFDEEAIVLAREILKEYTQEGSGYVIPKEEMNGLGEQLQAIEGYISGDVPIEDTDECLIVLESE